MSGEPVLFDRDGVIARVTLNRPEAGNAIDLATAEALVDAAARCDDDAIRCVVLTGAGRLFCTGGDIALMAAGGDQVSDILYRLASTFHVALQRLGALRKPLIVLVNGPAAGAGFSLALAGDIVLAARSAHFTAAYSSIGLTPDGGISWLLPRLVGLRKAQEILVANRRVDAAEAERIGLVTRMVEDEQLEAEGVAYAATFARAATQALGNTRQLIREGLVSSLEAQLESEARTIANSGLSADGREGVASFLARRKPDFGAGS